MTPLYTEEQVKQMIEKSRETGLTAEYLILATTPIELPTDEGKYDISQIKIQILQEVFEDIKKMYIPDGEDYAELETEWVGNHLKVLINFDKKKFEEDLLMDIEHLIDEKIELIKNEINQK